MPQLPPAVQGARTASMSSQTQSSQWSSAKGMGRQAVGRVFALTPVEPEDDALLVKGMILVSSSLLVEGMILVYGTWVVTLTLEENKSFNTTGK